MQSIKVKSHIGNDGILHIPLPEIRDTEVEAIIVYQPLQKIEKPSLASLYGICADDPIIIDNEGILESLDDNLEGIFDHWNDLPNWDEVFLMIQLEHSEIFWLMPTLRERCT